MVRIEPVNPVEFADAASRILEESWPTPHVRYSPQYLRWQFGFPGPLPPLAVAAFEDAEPVGFAGATPRRARFRGHSAPLYIVSFVSVRPAWRRSGIAAALYAELLRSVRGTQAPVVTFAETGSAGQRQLLRSYDAAAFHVRPLGECPVYGYLPPPNAHARRNVEWTEQIDQLLPLIRAADDTHMIRHDPDDTVISHLSADPRFRRVVLARGPGGASAGAMVIQSEIVGRAGRELVLQIEHPCLPQATGELLRDLFTTIAGQSATLGEPVFVTAPNLSGIDPTLLRAAGLRQTRSVFAGYVCAPSSNSLVLQADAVDLEVI